MCGENKHLGNLNMLRSLGTIEGRVGDVLTRQRLDTLINFVCALVVTLEARKAEIRFHASGRVRRK